MLDYAIVVATRNRIEALRASVPLFLGQSRPPARIVVVDRSDDHAAVAEYLSDLVRGGAIPVEVIHGDRANLPHQRNLGLARVAEPVVLLPDDDSLWFADTAAKIMAVYDRDPGGLIGGVAGIGIAVSPLAGDRAPENARRFMRRPGIERWRNRIEERFVPQPFNLYARLRIAALRPEAAAAGLDDLRLVETISGWRMSYRTEIARSLGYDATLGSRVGYAQHEDKDMSLRVQQAGHLLAAAPGARVFHNVHPGKRAGGFAYGFCWLFNYAYICRKVFGDAPPGRVPVRRYIGYKAFLYRLRRGNEYDRDVARGGAAALAEFDRLWQAPDDRLADTYGEICGRVLSGDGLRP
jgi:glycosyltransferase involved in cell wall biosynthesis